MSDRMNVVEWFGRSGKALVLLWALFLIPRAALILLEVTPTSDADWYYKRAGELAAGLGYLGKTGEPTAFWPPGWPMALSLAFRLLGTSVTTLGLFNLACAALSAWLVLALGRRISGSELAARLGLLLLAVYPNAIAYVPLALTEVFYTTLLLAICWLLVDQRSRLAFVAAGLLLGVAVLVKAQTLAVIPLIFGVGLLRKPGFFRALPRAAMQMALLAALAACAVAPWTWRNHVVMGEWIAVSANGGITLYTGNNDTARGEFAPDDPGVKKLFARNLHELQYDAEAKRLGKEWIRAHPLGFLKLMPLKFFHLWRTDGEAQWFYELGYRRYAEFEMLFRAVRVANQLWYWGLLAGFAIAAVAIPRRRRRQGRRIAGWWLLPYGIAVYPSAVAMIFSGQSRFHYPVMPFICIVSGLLLAQWLTTRRTGASAAA